MVNSLSTGATIRKPLPFNRAADSHLPSLATRHHGREAPTPMLGKLEQHRLQANVILSERVIGCWTLGAPFQRDHRLSAARPAGRSGMTTAVRPPPSSSCGNRSGNRCGRRSTATMPAGLRDAASRNRRPLHGGRWSQVPTLRLKVQRRSTFDRSNTSLVPSHTTAAGRL